MLFPLLLYGLRRQFPEGWFNFLTNLVSRLSFFSKFSGRNFKKKFGQVT